LYICTVLNIKRMIKKLAVVVCWMAMSLSVLAQPGKAGRDELERQRKQLKAEIDEQEKLLKDIKKTTSENLVQLNAIDKKMNLQDRVIDNIGRDINLLDNNIYNSQREINKLNLVLDTLKQEYAKSMVYAYKNRSNYDFINFIFSARNFNDAIKRIAYLKSYRNYRELQGENIQRTQQLLRVRIAELSGNKQIKNTVMSEKSRELDELEKQKQKKDQIVNQLKSKSKELAGQIAAKRKQMQKVKTAIDLAIKKAQEEARKQAIAAAAAAEKQRKLDEENRRKALAANPGTTPPAAKNTGKTTTVTPKAQESVLLNNANTIRINAGFEGNRGSLPWPVDKGYVSMHYGSNELPGGGGKINNPGVTIITDIGAPVKAIFDGLVSKVVYVENMQVVILQHGKYFSSYSNLGSVSVQPGQSVKTGQVLGKAAANDEGVGSIDLLMDSERGEINPENWLGRR
jgi:murein hydrolase activator